MATAQLGTFSYDMVLNYAKWTDSLAKAERAANNTTKAIERGFEKIGDGFSDLANKIVGALAIDQLVEFGAKAIETADQVGKMAQKVGISVESLSALSAQARLSNVSTDELQVGLTKLAKSATDAAAGNKQSAASFAAIGVSLRDSNGNLKSTEQLLGDVAAKFASYRDSATKTADAQAFFGKSGAQLIPLLNELGEGGFKKAREEAEKYGAVISGDTAKASAEFNDNLTRLKLEAEGFANAVVSQLLPGLNQISGAMVKAGETTNSYGNSATVVANAIKGLVVGLVTAKEFLASVATVTFAFYDAVKTTFEASGKVVAAFGLAAYQELKAAFTLDGDALATARANLTTNLTKIGADVRASFIGIKDAVSGGVGNSVDTVRKTLDALFGTFANVSGGADTTAKNLGKLPAPLIASADAADKAQKALEAYNKAQLDAAAFLSQLRGGLDPISKAYETYTQSIIKSNEIQQKIITTATEAGHAQEGYAQAVEFGRQANEEANKVLDATLVKLAKQRDVLGTLEKEYSDQRALIGLTDREKAIAEAVEHATDMWMKNKDLLVGNAQSLEDVQNGARAMAAANFDLTESVKNSQAVWQGWTNIVTGAANSLVDDFAKAVVEGGSLLDSLANTAKQVVEQIISYFLKLAIINPILNAVFGDAITAGGGSLLPTLASAFGGGGVGGATGTFSGGGLMDIGKGIWNGMEGGFQQFMSSGDAFTMGPPDASGATSSYYGGGYTSGFGQALGIAGGVYAGYNEFNRAGGGAAGAAGGAAYGVGTYFAGAGIATAAATGSIALGLAAIPVVGWIAIAAMLIDKFSGGKLFGTKGEMHGGSSALHISSTGADYTTGISLKGQKPLFGGSKYSWETLAETPEQKEAAQAFFDSMTKQMKQYAESFGVKAGDLISATFEQQFDKHGNLTGKSTATIGNYTYKDLTAEQFSQAYFAANELTVLDQFDAKLEDTIATYRKGADTLVEIANGLTNAEGYLQAGGDFLAIAGKDTLSQIVKLAEGMQQAGETIDQTIGRLIQAQQQYDQFVGQFKQGPTFVDDFQAALADINNQMIANAAQANALAQAAGAEHASTQDLINIHNYAAKQFAAAVAQLKANANSLAASLGYALPNSLDDIDSEISALESKAGSGASAIGGFGNAMHEAAQRATDAMNLLLGDLSPLNDQQKWQAALQGLRAGTATAQQALEIARRLFGTGADYTNAFNQVMALQRPGAAGTVSPAGGGQHGLTAAEQKRLDDLKARREQLQAEKQHADALTLAQDIADIASSTGESIDQALKDVGITDLPAFMKELGVTDKAAFDKFIEKLEAQTDSAGDDTASLSTDIQTGNSILMDIRDGIDQLNGNPVHSRNDQTGAMDDTGAPMPPHGHSGHGYQTPNQRGTRVSLDYTRTR